MKRSRIGLIIVAVGAGMIGIYLLLVIFNFSVWLITSLEFPLIGIILIIAGVIAFAYYRGREEVTPELKSITTKKGIRIELVEETD